MKLQPPDFWQGIKATQWRKNGLFQQFILEFTDKQKKKKRKENLNLRLYAKTNQLK